MARKNHDLFLIVEPTDGVDTDVFTHVEVDESSGIPKKINSDVQLSYRGRRKVMNLARCGEGDDTGPKRGPGFSILPNRPDPDSSQMCCYLINAENLNAANPWTAAEWNESDDAENNDLEQYESDHFDKAEFDVLLAAPRGEVYFLQKEDNKEPSIKLLSNRELSVESELWSQLRNGLVAGSVNYFGHPDSKRRDVDGKAVVAVNLTSVMPTK